MSIRNVSYLCVAAVCAVSCSSGRARRPVRKATAKSGSRETAVAAKTEAPERTAPGPGSPTVAAASPRAAFPPLPDPEPYLASRGTARQDPVFKVGSFAYHKHGSREGALYEQPSYVVGNKAVIVRKVDGRNRPDQDQTVQVYVDGKQACRFMWWGSYKGGGYGYPFKAIEGDDATLTVDRGAKTTTYRKPYLTPAGKRAEFTYTIKPLKESKVELSWDLGVTQREVEGSKVAFGAQPWLLFKNYRGKRITVGGKKLAQASRDDLVASKKRTDGLRGDLVYDAAHPVKGYRLELGDLRGGVTESITVPRMGPDRYECIYRAGYPKPRAAGKIVIDLGEASLPREDAPPPVGGIDFWKIDATHVPPSPTRNVMPNPSFEQGLRYWRWTGGGATYRPGNPPRYETVPQGRFGTHALIVRDTQHGGPAILSFPMSLDRDATYTLSFYAKARSNRKIKVPLKSAARGGRFVHKQGWPFGDIDRPVSEFAITTAWKRYSRTFKADGAGLQVGIFAGGDTLIDGMQLEKGDAPTEFIAPPLDAMVTTSDPDNDLVAGAPIDAALRVAGEPGARGTVTVAAKNAFRETVYEGTFDVAIGADGTAKVELPFSAKKLGTGVFVVSVACEVDGVPPYVDYHRMSIMKSLHNTHATKNIFGTLGHYARVTRGEELAAKYRDWGFGSTSWGFHYDSQGPGPALEKKYGIANIANIITNQDREIGGSYRQWKSISPELEKRIEQVAYEAAKHFDPEQFPVWAFGNEEEGSYLVRNKKFDEYFKAQSATARGVKRANPKAIVMPTCGTSGYSIMRGYEAIEGYLKTAQKHGFRYDAVAVHPYGNIDKGTLSSNDLDEETARLIAQMKKYGYGTDTPIYYTELFNIPETYVPAWNAGGSYDSYGAGKPTYDFGNREFVHASSVARAYIIMLKYWPQVQASNIWTARPFMDMRLTPLLLCKAVNTLGHHLGYVEFQADIKPAAGIRGYAFKLADGTGIAPVWCVNHDVENGLARGPALEVRFEQPVEFYDLMGNRRSARTAPDGTTRVRLTPAPLLIKARDVDKLAKALQNALTDDASSSISVCARPGVDGRVSVVVKNLTGRPQRGSVEVGGQTLSYDLSPEATKDLVVGGTRAANRPGTMYAWDNTLAIEPSKGDAFEREWKMTYFYVPRTRGMPDWNAVPPIPVANRYVKAYRVKEPGKPPTQVMPKAGYPGDLNATFKLAWDERNLYLRVEAEDDRFLTFPELWKRGNSYKLLYVHDGCLEVYFDTAADGRTNISKTYDNDDYRYDFSIGRNCASGPGMVYRLREVYHQLADGVNMATKEEAAKKIVCDFQRTAKGYTYTIVFGGRYLEPIVLRKGFIAGFALYLHDRDDSDVPPGVKAVSLATEPGSHCDYKPHVWPLMVLGD